MADGTQAILFDAGNTLVGWDLEFIGHVLQEVGLEMPADRLERAEAAARPELSATIARGRSTESGEIKLRYLQLFLERLDAGWALSDLVERLRDVPSAQLWARLLPGVPEALARFAAAGIRLGVVSNADGTMASQLDAHGIGGFFDVLIDSGAAGVEKPDPAIFHLALDALGVPPHAAVHVGDLYAVDVVGARAAGIRPLLLDPFGDWGQVDCETHPDVTGVAASLLGMPPTSAEPREAADGGGRGRVIDPRSHRIATKDLAVESPVPMDALLGGYPWVARMTDKARASRAVSLGTFMYPCPIDRRCLGLLGLSPERFADLATSVSTGQALLDALADAGAAPPADAQFDPVAYEDELNAE